MKNNIGDDIDDSELEKKNLKSIKEIAQSYSISTTRLKKPEIIEKIKSIVKRKREYEEEQKQKQNVNSFNKIIKLTITDNIEPSGVSEGINEINEKSTLKTLITTARLILKLITPPPPKKDEEEEDDDDEEKELSKNIIKPITTIDEIDNFIKKINKVNLKSLLDDPINFNNNNNNEIKYFIKKLLNFYYSTFNYKISKGLYFCYYYEEFKDDYKNIYPSRCLIEMEIRFGIFEVLQSTYEDAMDNLETILSSIIFYNCGDDNSKVLFSHCYDKEKKIKFIDDIIQTNIQQPKPGFPSGYFLCLLVIHNDIELVKYYSNKVGNHIQANFNNSLLPPTYYIETVSYSMEFLKFIDWINTNYNDELKNGAIFGFKKERYQYHLLISIYRFDFNNNIINKYYNGNEEENDVYIERLELLLKDVIQFTPYLFEVNNFKFLNWFLTIIKKYHNSSSIIPSTTNYFNISDVILRLMNHESYYIKFKITNTLILHQNFHFILKKQSDGGILNILYLKYFLFSSIERGITKISNFLFQFISITKKEFEKYSNKYNK
ncbi:hypothetical protein ACTFIZ_001935 [Dictyostelium cf. discoideum]